MMRKKMSGMKLSQFSGIKNQTDSESNFPNTQAETVSPIVEEIQVLSSNKQIEIQVSNISPIPEPVVKEKPVTINIKITRVQHDWLMDTAQMVRDNNTEPVPPGERVYPQHLIGFAIELLQTSDIDWKQIKNTEDLKQLLNT